MFSFWCCVVAGSMWKMELGSEEPPAYPERHGRPDCAYYMRTGTCGFGDGCRYNHPRDRRMSTIAPSHQQYPVITSWEVARSSMLPPSYMQGPYGPMLLFPGIMPDPGWSTFPVTPSPPMSTGGEQNTVLEESQYDSAAQTSRLHPAHSKSYPMAVSDWNSESERNEDFEWDSDDEATTGDDAPSSDPPACPPGEVVLSSPWRSGPSNLALI
ncbi:hypothetical protein GW17_00019445 [Ensete ventricosum]|nr:hypothetical protein GW17_00019445 [Ensete ventricosum]